MSEQEGIDYFAGVSELTAGSDGAEVISGFLVGIKAAPFDLNEPLPPLKPHPRTHSWEPAARRFRDIEDGEQ